MISSHPKCTISIELNDSTSRFIAGGLVEGTVQIRVHETTKCNGISIYNLWKTHGKGNTSTGKSETILLQTGDLNEGESLNLPFKLRLLEWPPTYHGHYFNVDHSIEVHVDIPWAFDIKQSVPIVVYGGPGHDKAPTDLTQQQNSLLGCAIAALVLGFFPFFFAIMLFTASGGFLIFGLFALIAGGFWLAKVFLPRWKLGKVNVTFPADAVHPSETLHGKLELAPKGQVQINAISIETTCAEVCVSGSGSNRKTHRHELWRSTETILDSGNLKPGKQSLDFSLHLPASSVPTIKVTDNEIRWQMQLRIDIPRWPDYVYSASFVVHPDPDHVAVVVPTESSSSSDSGTLNASDSHNPTADRGNELSFSETAAFLVAARGDQEQIATIVEAMSGIELPIAVKIQRTTLYAGTNDRGFAYPNGTIVQAEDLTSELEVTLYLPRSETVKIEHMGEREWRGLGTIVGYDYQHNRLRIRAIEGTET